LKNAIVGHSSFHWLSVKKNMIESNELVAFGNQLPKIMLEAQVLLFNFDFEVNHSFYSPKHGVIISVKVENVACHVGQLLITLGNQIFDN